MKQSEHLWFTFRQEVSVFHFRFAMFQTVSASDTPAVKPANVRF